MSESSQDIRRRIVLLDQRILNRWLWSYFSHLRWYIKRRKYFKKTTSTVMKAQNLQTLNDHWSLKNRTRPQEGTLKAFLMCPISTNKCPQQILSFIKKSFYSQFLVLKIKTQLINLRNWDKVKVKDTSPARNNQRKNQSNFYRNWWKTWINLKMRLASYSSKTSGCTNLLSIPRARPNKLIL